MGWSIDVEKIRAAVEKYGFDIPFYTYQTDIPQANLNALIKNGLLIRGGTKRRGYIFTDGVNALLTEAGDREARVRAMKEEFLSLREPKRGRAFGTRRVPSLPDSDRNATDHESIDEN